MPRLPEPGQRSPLAVRQQQQQEQQQQSQQQEQQQQQPGHQRQRHQPRPLLNWKLQFRDPALERLYVQQSSEQQLMLDYTVMFLNLLVLLNVGSSRLEAGQALVHSISLALLAVQGCAMLMQQEGYLQHRPLLMVLQRLWRTLLRLQIMQQQLQAAAAFIKSATSGRLFGQALLLQLVSALSKRMPELQSAAAAVSAGAARTAGFCTPTAAVRSSSGASFPTAAGSVVGVGAGGGRGSAPPRLLLDLLLISSDVVPNWAYLWAFQAPWSAVPLLQTLCLLLAAAADVPRLLCRLSAPSLQPLVINSFTTLSAASNLLLLPLVPEASVVAGCSCPAVPALPLVLWVQLFLLLLVPLYISYHWERASKIWWWLRQLSVQPHVPQQLADEAQVLLREVRPAFRVNLQHVVVLLLLAALCWQLCELSYWLLISDVWVQQVGQLMAVGAPPQP